MLARVGTVALEGIAARRVEVEVDLSRGMPSLNMVGLPDGAVREAKDRVRAALSNSGFQLPSLRITINLAPADLPKEGSGYDLPVAVGLLAAMGSVPATSTEGRVFLGELSLDGRLNAVPGSLPTALYARQEGIREVIVPEANGAEAALVPGIQVIAVATITQLVAHLRGAPPLPPLPATEWQQWLGRIDPGTRELAEVKGQEFAKRALEVAAVGGHNLVMSGPPGSGKTLLARCIAGLLPPLSLDEALEVTAIWSVAGRLTQGSPLVGTRPFRAPHHTASAISLIGGGSSPRPGEVSLSHNGVLFLDELTEFGRTTLEVLREPLEAGMVTISRAQRSANFPAVFQLIAAFNPCPCGHMGDPYHECRCSSSQVARYRARLSGPLLDRIDIHIQVPPVPVEKLMHLPGGERSATVRERVMAARDRQRERNGPGCLNATLQGADLECHAALDAEGTELLRHAAKRLGFSARGFHRILRVARSIADLEQAERIHAGHLGEAIQYRLESGLNASGT
ncbi:MAG: YifB family Mg chelatase-like AAA ATPase [Magnetococcales bacterium]|nr:YifB family Mg chelatase-like AAA ATPase [Magnetococcales bacterium]MBF0322139.1 YifB family Mg chelatase-like AAA ATPase [Magnetococcales bacterium]